ncbi:MAG: hypothetical protein Sapg2KO_13660 [Saprospiraceae bacterium]
MTKPPRNIPIPKTRHFKSYVIKGETTQIHKTNEDTIPTMLIFPIVLFPHFESATNKRAILE